MIGKVCIYKLIICAQRDFSTVIILSIFRDAVLRIIGECVLVCLAYERILYFDSLENLHIHAELNELYLVELARSSCYVRLVHHTFGGRDRNERQIESGDVLALADGLKVANGYAVLKELYLVETS